MFKYIYIPLGRMKAKTVEYQVQIKTQESEKNRRDRQTTNYRYEVR